MDADTNHDTLRLIHFHEIGLEQNLPHCATFVDQQSPVDLHVLVAKLRQAFGLCFSDAFEQLSSSCETPKLRGFAQTLTIETTKTGQASTLLRTSLDAWLILASISISPKLITLSASIPLLSLAAQPAGFSTYLVPYHTNTHSKTLECNIFSHLYTCRSLS